MKQVLKGGIADRKSPSEFDPASLREGRKVESEHTSDPRIATEIAMDHLTEDPRYYEKLKKMEKKASELTTKARNSLSDSSFVFPGERRYPIHDRAHARNALARAAGKSEEAKVRAAVRAKYPDIGGKEKLSFFGSKRTSFNLVSSDEKREYDTILKSKEFGKWKATAKPGETYRSGKWMMTKEGSARLAMYLAFEDEMSKIAAAGAMTNIGGRITSWVGKKAKSIGGWAKKQPGNLLEAGAAHLNPVKGLKEGWKFNWDPKTGGGNMGRALFLGGTALSAGSIIPKNDPMGNGDSRMTRALRFAGGTATGLIASKYGVLPSIAYGIAGDMAGGAIGKRIDKARGYKPPPPPPPKAAPAAPAPTPAAPVGTEQA